MNTTEALAERAAASILEAAAERRAYEAFAALTSGQRRRWVRGEKARLSLRSAKPAFPNDLGGYSPAVAQEKRQARLKRDQDFRAAAPVELFYSLVAAYLTRRTKASQRAADQLNAKLRRKFAIAA
jgi:hypothetical protein